MIQYQVMIFDCLGDAWRKEIEKSTKNYLIFSQKKKTHTWPLEIQDGKNVFFFLILILSRPLPKIINDHPLGQVYGMNV